MEKEEKCFCLNRVMCKCSFSPQRKRAYFLPKKGIYQNFEDEKNTSIEFIAQYKMKGNTWNEHTNVII